MIIKRILIGRRDMKPTRAFGTRSSHALTNENSSQNGDSPHHLFGGVAIGDLVSSGANVNKGLLRDVLVDGGDGGPGIHGLVSITEKK